jgi:transglutaminase-like putative cysteine protease
VIDPPPTDQFEHRDYFGNRVVYFEISSPHRRLDVSAESVVETDGRQSHLSLLTDQPWEAARPTTASAPDAAAATDYVLDSPLASVTPALGAYARSSFSPGRPLVEALTDLGDRIHRDLRYRPGSTSVSTTADQALAAGQGVCQDFAHVMIAGLRSLGLAARYVSGYLETDPPPGQPKLVGRDVSHAWASLYVPGVGWVDYDPTNRQLVDDRYVTTAWGREYGDIPPIKGVIFTEGMSSELEVAVDVVREPDAPRP